MRSSARRRIQPRDDIMQQSLSEVILEKDLIEEKENPFCPELSSSLSLDGIEKNYRIK